VIHNRQLFIHATPSVLPLRRRLPGRPSIAILDEPRRAYTAAEAYAYCERMARTRYENVPVASRFVPDAVRPHVLAIYAFARAADDFADEPEYTGKRQTALDEWESELFRTFHGEADHPIFVALRHTVEHCELPITPFTDLLTAFRMDISPVPPVSFEELRTYCRHAAEPLGQLMLLVFGYRNPSLFGFAGDLCTGLQLASFLQDLGRDLPRGRLHLPLEDLRHFGILPEGVRTAPASAHLLGASSKAWRDLLRFQVARARTLLLRGRPLVDEVGPDLAIELELTYCSGQAILDKIEALGDELLRGRPTLGRADRARVLGKALGRRWPQVLRRRAELLER
jgi:squalene synthase HpnC